jgi:TIR domain
MRQPGDFYSCFISYSTKDNPFIQRLYADLKAIGIMCWFAPKDLKIGAKFRVEIDDAIRVYDKLLIVLSKRSVQSEWVEKEVETAFEKERKEKRLVLFPIRLDQAVMKVAVGWAADIRRTRHIGDFRNWKDPSAYAKAFDRLLRDLKSDTPKPDAAKVDGEQHP